MPNANEQQGVNDPRAAPSGAQEGAQPGDDHMYMEVSWLLASTWFQLSPSSIHAVGSCLSNWTYILQSGWYSQITLSKLEKPKIRVHSYQMDFL